MALLAGRDGALAPSETRSPSLRLKKNKTGLAGIAPISPAKNCARLTAFATFVTPIALATAGPALLRSAFFTRTRDIHGQGAALKFLVMELLDGFVRVIRIGEFNEREAAGFAGHFVHHEVDRVNSASLGKIILKIIFHGLVGQVAYEEPGGIHIRVSLKKPRGGLHRQDH
jgi:hypothetical protein